MRLSDIRKQLTKNGYLPNDEIVMAAYGHYMVSHYWSSLTRGREKQVLL